MTDLLVRWGWGILRNGGNLSNGGMILCGGFNNPLWTMFLEKQLPVLQVKSQLLPHNKNENSFLNKTNQKNSKKGNNISTSRNATTAFSQKKLVQTSEKQISQQHVRIDSIFPESKL